MDNHSASPLFSVVIPIFNRAGIIARTIDSVLAQTFTDFEIIVVDDGSTDDLKKVCDGYNSPKIRYIYQDNAGSNPARNNGVKNSRGHYVSFLDSDDTWEAEYLDEILKKFNSDNEIGFVWTRNIKKYLPEGVMVLKKYKKLEGFVYREVLKQGYLINSSCITAKRSLLEMIGGWDNNLRACQDDDICFRLAKATKVGYVDKILSTFYIDERIDRISASSSRRAWNSFFLWQKFADDLVLLCGENELVNKVVNVYFRFSQINDREGIEHCEQLLSKYLKYLHVGMLQFRIKYIFALFLAQSKYIIKKIMGETTN
jgi:glycosyltransferase involved in cell wall biosynthesis